MLTVIATYLTLTFLLAVVLGVGINRMGKS